MFILLSFLLSNLYSLTLAPIDYIEPGSVEEGESSYFIISRPDPGSPENFEDDVLRTTIYYYNPSLLANTQSLFWGPVECAQVADIDGNGIDEAIFLLRDDTTNPEFIQLLSPLTDENPNIFNRFRVHFSLREARIMYASDFDVNGDYDFVIAKANQKQLQYQFLLNPEIHDISNSHDIMVNTPIHSISLPFGIKKTHLLKGVNTQSQEHFFYIQGNQESACYVYDIDSQSFKLIEVLALPGDPSVSGPLIKKVQPIQATKESFISNFNVVIQYYNKTSFLLYTKKGMTKFKEAWFGVSDYLEENYYLDEIYVPEKFENRIAVWYQSKQDETGELVFFTVIEDPDHISCIEETGDSIEPHAFDRKPKIVTYLPAYVDENQVSPGVSKWVVAQHTQEASNYDSLVIEIEYQSNP